MNQGRTEGRTEGKKEERVGGMSGMDVGVWLWDSPAYRQYGGGCEWAAGYT